jgi:hypothetical protein
MTFLSEPAVSKFFQPCVEALHGSGLPIPCFQPFAASSNGSSVAGSTARMIYFYRRAGDTRICETRLEPDGPGFELVVIEGRESRVERFTDVRELATRESELRHAWLLNGWRTLDEEHDEVE